MSKIRVSWEITDNWDIDSFRRFIKLLLSDDEKYEVFIISNDDTAARIVTIGNSLGLLSSEIIICNFTADKVQAIIDNEIDIHLDNLQSFVMLVDETTDAYGILVTPNLNRFYVESDFIIVFNKLVKQINTSET